MSILYCLSFLNNVHKTESTHEQRTQKHWSDYRLWRDVWDSCIHAVRSCMRRVECVSVTTSGFWSAVTARSLKPVSVDVTWVSRRRSMAPPNDDFGEKKRTWTYNALCVLNGSLCGGATGLIAAENTGNGYIVLSNRPTPNLLLNVAERCHRHRTCLTIPF